MVGKGGIAFHAGNFQALGGEFGGHHCGGLTLAAEYGSFHMPHAGDPLRGGENRTQINRVAKREIVRMEKARCAVRPAARAEDRQQRAFHIAAEIAGQHADGEGDFQ